MDWGESEQQGLALQACAMLPESRARLESDQTGWIEGCIMRTWQMQEAKSRLSEVLKDEERQGPLPIDAQVADRWGHLVAQADRSLPAIDSLLAATALTYLKFQVQQKSYYFLNLVHGKIITVSDQKELS